MIDLRRLRVLREVHVRGTLHAAARALGYTPSAISQQLAALEREAGAPLLERVGRGVRLTEAGAVLVRHADGLLDAMEAAQAEVAAVAAGRLAGTVRVAAFQSAFLRMVAPTIRTLSGHATPASGSRPPSPRSSRPCPPCACTSSTSSSATSTSGSRGCCTRSCERETVLREGINLVLPADHPEATADRVPLSRLAEMPWATSQPGTGHHDMHVRACREIGGFEPDVRYTSDDFLIQLELVRTTGAGALLPDLVLGFDAPGVVVRPLRSGAVGREVFLLTRRSRTPSVREVADVLRRTGAAARRRRRQRDGPAPAGVGAAGRRVRGCVSA